MLRGKRKVILRFLAWTISGLLILLAALPLWFPWVLTPGAKRAGLSYARYAREGYRHFRLTGVAFTSKSGSTLRVDEVRGLVPTAWAVRLVLNRGPAPFLQVNGWQYESHPGTSGGGSASGNFARLERDFAQLRKWLPAAELTNGTIRIRGRTLAIPEATWRNGSLSARAVLPGNHPAVLHLATGRRLRAELSGELPQLTYQSTWAASNTAAGLRVSGDIHWFTNNTELSATFARQGALPEMAELRADRLSVPGSLIGLRPFQQLNGSALVEWRTNTFAINASARALPQSTNLPALNLVLRASGTTNFAQIDTLTLTAPGFAMTFTPGTRIGFAPPFLTGPATLQVSEDLTNQPWFPASGTLTGKVVLEHSDRPYPRATFALIGANVTVSNVHTRSLSLQGAFDWPTLRLTRFALATTDGSEAGLTGTVDLSAKTVVDGRLQYRGTLGKELLPKGYSFERANLDARFSGPFATLSHSGTVDITQLEWPRSKPARLNATWNGRGRQIQSADLALTAGNSAIRLRGALDAGPAAWDLVLSALSFRSQSNVELQLERPVGVAFRKLTGGTNRASRWSVRSERLALSGGESSLSLAGAIDWPWQGSWQVAARHLNSAWLTDFFQLPPTEVDVREITGSGGWTNGPVTAAFETAAALHTRSAGDISIRADVGSSKEGISVRQLSVSTVTQTVVSAEGTVPWVLHPGAAAGALELLPEKPLQLRVFTETNSAFWTELEKETGLRLSEPRVLADLTGTWEQPVGRASVSAREIHWERARRPLPSLNDFRFELDCNRDQANAQLTASVEQQPVHITANIPLGSEFWGGLIHERRVPDWRRLHAALQVEDVQLAAFAPFAPRLLTPQGQLTAQVRLEPGGKLSGEAVLQHAATRPLATLGPIRNIQADLRLADDLVVLTNCSAQIGGQRVDVAGRAELKGQFWRKETLPPFQLYLHGTNVPLVRQPEVLVRADLNLAVTNSGPTNAVIGGAVRLRDSFFLSDLKALAPGRVTAPRRRPPYFSIEEEPWAEWQLDVRAEGDQFLKVRSPLFRGTASANLRLQGTLKDPVALGELRVASGSVSFPFGSLPVQQGFITLGSDDPHRPKLLINASAERMGYDIKMEVTGWADEPIVQFSSSPPLSSQQIVLMLTTGQAPPGVATASTQQRAQGLALFVGRNVLSDLGFDGGEDRLTIRSGEQLTESGKPTYELEYRLTKKWSVVGEYDRFSDYNVGLKWKVYAK